MARLEQISEKLFVKVPSSTDIILLNKIGTLAEAQEDLQSAAEASFLNITDQIDAQALVVSGIIAEVGAASSLSTVRYNEIISEITGLKGSPSATPYTKSEIDKMIVPWKVEEINEISGTLTNALFDNRAMSDIRFGYQFFSEARLNIPVSTAFYPNTIKRFSINVFVTLPKVVQLQVMHNDNAAVYLRGTLVGQMFGNNYGGQAVQVSLPLSTGWNLIQVLISNLDYDGGIDIGVNLASQVTALKVLHPMSGKISAAMIQNGSIGPEHIKSGVTFNFGDVNVSGTWGGVSAPYTKTETDSTLAGIYTKAEMDIILGQIYTKTEMDLILAGYTPLPEGD